MYESTRIRSSIFNQCLPIALPVSLNHQVNTNIVINVESLRSFQEIIETLATQSINSITIHCVLDPILTNVCAPAQSAKGIFFDFTL